MRSSKRIMKSKARVRRLRIEVFSHATEDINKVKKAILTLIPSELRDNVELAITKVKGYYGNEINIINVDLSKKAKYVLKHILCSLTTTERSIITATIDTRVDSKLSHLFLRVSKQDAYLGQIRLMEGSDVIKIVATIVGLRSIEELREFIEELVSNC